MNVARRGARSVVRRRISSPRLRELADQLNGVGGVADRGVYRCEVYLDEVWLGVSIQGFARKEIEAFFLSGRLPRGEGWASSASIAKRKLDMLDYAAILNDLASPPGNRLEALKGDLKGLHSIRINDQWRIIFRWTADGPDKVDICDYH